MVRLTPAAAATAALVTLMAAPPAGASTVEFHADSPVGNSVYYRGAPGETNQLTVAKRANGIRLTDPAAIMTQGSTPNPTGPSCLAALHQATCTGTPWTLILELGDGDEAFRVGFELTAYIDGGPGDDRLEGGPGYQEISGGPGADDLRAGTGETIDWAKIGNPTGGVTASLDDLPNDGQPGEGDNIHSDFYGLEGGPFDDHLIGDADANGLGGHNGDDVLEGGAGDDSLRGENGNDTLVGGSGEDLLTDLVGDNTYEARDGERDTIQCGPGYDRVFADALDDVQNVWPCDEVAIG